MFLWTFLRVIIIVITVNIFRAYGSWWDGGFECLCTLSAIEPDVFWDLIAVDQHPGHKKVEILGNKH